MVRFYRIARHSLVTILSLNLALGLLEQHSNLVAGTPARLLRRVLLSQDLKRVSVDTFDRNAAPGGSAVYNLTIYSYGGFTGNVTLTSSNLPAGVTVSFAPPVVTGGSGTSAITVQTSNSTPSGTRGVTITATSGSMVRSTTLNLIIGASDFTGNVTPTYPAEVPRGAARYAVYAYTIGTLPFYNSISSSASNSQSA